MMALFLAPNNQRNGANHAAAHVVPPAAVWEPPRDSAALRSTHRVRTLHRRDRTSAAELREQRERAAARAARRTEAGRTYLLGAAIGFSFAVGCLSTMDGETAAGTPVVAETVTAGVAK